MSIDARRIAAEAVAASTSSASVSAIVAFAVTHALHVSLAFTLGILPSGGFLACALFVDLRACQRVPC